MADRIMIPADAVEMRLREIWEDTRQLATRIGNTYGVDQVGKCIQAVRELALAAQRAASAEQENPEPDLATSFLGMEPCPCGRPELGQHEKPVALWLCRAGYLQKEIGYALSELGRGGEAWAGHSWSAAGIARLEKLAGAGGNRG